MKHHLTTDGSGFTLVEMVIAVLITLIVLGGVYQTMTSESIDRDVEESVIDMQNNARAAIVQIGKDVKGAGFFGCGGNLAANTIKNADKDANVGVEAREFIGNMLKDVNLPAGVTKWDSAKTLLTTLKEIPDTDFNVGYLAVPMAVYNDVDSAETRFQPGSDVLALFTLTDQIYQDTDMTTPADDLDLEERHFNKGDIVYVTDCIDYSIFQKSNCDDTKVLRHDANTDGCTSETPALLPQNDSNSLGKIYKTSDKVVMLYRLGITTYFLKENTLYRDHSSNPLASNVEDLQFEFVFDENANDTVSDEIAADNWRDTLDEKNNNGAFSAARARAVRIWILTMSDPSSGYVDKNFYHYPNSPYDISPPSVVNPAMANRYRYLMNAVIYLRNAGLDPNNKK
ncbi:MAG: PilW family protein [Proteobacteria bacterium]|nr:PilW family protein [Pseudomonadota bacterium]MBU1686291.1 PilW family protein [Pseudomonadota bacterium]